MPAPVTSTVAIKTYFETEPHARKIEMVELKALSPAERLELGTLCAAALGLSLAVDAPKS